MTISANESQILILSLLVNISPWADILWTKLYECLFCCESITTPIALKSQCCCVLLPSYDKYEFYFLPSLVDPDLQRGCWKLAFKTAYGHFFSKMA